MIGVEFDGPDGNIIPTFRNEIADRCFLNGLLTLACGESTLRIAPPLVISMEQMENGLDTLEHVIASLEAMGQPGITHHPRTIVRLYDTGRSKVPAP